MGIMLILEKGAKGYTPNLKRWSLVLFYVRWEKEQNSFTVSPRQAGSSSARASTPIALGAREQSSQ